MRPIKCFLGALALLSLLTLGCDDIDVSGPGPKAGGQCTPKCVTPSVCSQGKCCTPTCDRPDGSLKECGPDMCGNTCGVCGQDKTCDNQGACLPGS